LPSISNAMCSYIILLLVFFMEHYAMTLNLRY